MPVELPKRNKRGLPITLSIGAIAVSAIVTLAIQPKDDPAPSMKVVGVAAVRSADPTSTGSRIPDPLEIAKKKAKKKAATVSSGGGSGAATANVGSGVSSGSSSSGATATGATANRTYTPPRSSGSSGSTSKKSSGSSGTSAAEAEFGPG